MIQGLLDPLFPLARLGQTQLDAVVERVAGGRRSLEAALIDQEERVLRYCERTLSPLAIRTGARLRFIRESVRRLVLHNEIPEAERFKIASTDVIGLNSALLGAEGWFEPAVARVLGNGARIYGKPGQVPRRDCLDVTLIEGRNGQRILLSATVPEGQGGCPALVNLATAVLKYLSA